MGEVLFVVWRESVEALLVVGILYAWLSQHEAGGKGKRYLYAGVVVGLGLAAMLGALIYGTAHFMSEQARDVFMMVMMLVASGLIVQMVMWMRAHGRTLKSELETGIAKNAEKSSWWGVLVLVAIAIAREGSETVVFLSSKIMSLSAANALPFAIEVVIGLALALLTFYFLQLGGRYFSWKAFFRFTEIVLLFLGASLFMKGIEFAADNAMWLPDVWFDPLWSTSNLLDDSSPLGSFLASVFAYRSQPTWVSLVAFVVYWTVVLLLMFYKPLKNQFIRHEKAMA